MPDASPMPRLDHLTIMSRTFDVSAKFYQVLLPMLGFTQSARNIWHNDAGLYLQFMTAKAETGDYQRYGPGLNHLGFKAPDPEFVRSVATAMEAAGYEARLQSFPDSTVALFLPDPDGLRIEVSWYPPGTPPVQ